MPDETTATRLLRLLPLLTSTGGSRPPGPPRSRRTWAGGELADRWRVKALLAAPAADVAARVPATVAVIEALDEHSCLLTTGGHDLDYIAMHLAGVGIPFTPLEPPELRTRCAPLAARLSQAAESPLPGPERRIQTEIRCSTEI